MSKDDVTCPVLIVIDVQPVGNNLQIFNPPGTWISPHIGNKLRRVRRNRNGITCGTTPGIICPFPAAPYLPGR